ncbi:hypothetical protein ABIA32_002671 [Streptacidiphilus sp. MAP12-20]|uniref:hypothetical protein n=1 Tax=Streptacidiphilus sp. MAP12-20 TaxID=3156299 RepID=UPI003512EC90
MADALPIPDDLVQLQRDLDAAGAALAEYSQRKTAEYRERYPEPEQYRERNAWTEEESAELARLRAAQLELVMTIHRHATTQQALAGRSAWQTEQARKKAAREIAEAV